MRGQIWTLWQLFYNPLWVMNVLGLDESSCLLLSVSKQGHFFGFISLLCFFGFVVPDITYHFVVPRNKHNWIIYINKSLQAKTLLKVGSNLIASCAPLFLQCYCLRVLPYTLSLKWTTLFSLHGIVRPNVHI